MKGYYLKKVLSSLFVLFIIITLNFFLPRMIFKDPAQPYFAGVPEDAYALREQIREEHGFNDPLIVQYGDYLGRILTLDFGESHYYKESVWSVMFSRIPWSMVLTVSSMVVSVTFGILFGAIAGKKREHLADKILLNLSSITTAGYTLTFHGDVFLFVLVACVLLMVGLRLLTRKSLCIFIGIPVSLLLSLLASVPIDDVIDVAYYKMYSSHYLPWEEVYSPNTAI